MSKHSKTIKTDQNLKTSRVPIIIDVRENYYLDEDKIKSRVNIGIPNLRLNEILKLTR